MAIATVRRLAADILGVGESRIRFSPENIKEIEGALTRADVKGLIGKGFVTKKKAQGRASTTKRERRSAGHRRGIVVPAKEAWMMKVRAQRRFLRMLVSEGAVKKDAKRQLYGKIKSGIFRNKRAMLLYLKDNGLVAKDYEPKKPAFEKKAAPPAPKKAAATPAPGHPRPENRKPEAEARKPAAKHDKPEVHGHKEAHESHEHKPEHKEAHSEQKGERK